MVSSSKVAVVVVAVMVLIAALLTEPATASPALRLASRYPRRKSYKNYPLAGLLPHKVPCCWYGYDAEGFSRNGRDLRHQTP
ncbi:hypothetical protein O3P69_002310 [Scylla paramamosain]|uniref:Uncharacterized protein n=1 Tax=Scylla paramamosain TaxID=85552 RepID=A0AAW0V6J5_SCYPA